MSFLIAINFVKLMPKIELILNAKFVYRCDNLKA